MHAAFILPPLEINFVKFLGNIGDDHLGAIRYVHACGMAVVCFVEPHEWHQDGAEQGVCPAAVDG